MVTFCGGGPSLQYPKKAYSVNKRNNFRKVRLKSIYADVNYWMKPFFSHFTFAIFTLAIFPRSRKCLPDRDYDKGNYIQVW